LELTTRLLADAVVLMHLVFIIFVVTGAWFARTVHWLPWCHIPAVAWGAYVELTGTVCPLTPLENALRDLAGETTYSVSFVEKYLLPIIYPTDLTRELQLTLGVGVILLNVVGYAWLLYSRRLNSKRPL
jgi:hypothetical protein